MISVSINGFGTIGKRVADAVSVQPDMSVVGVSKRSPNHEARSAGANGYELYAVEPDRIGDFEERNIPVAGPVGDMLARTDIVVDTTPSGVGETYRDRCADHDVTVVYQGGEDASVAPQSFCARANYQRSVGEAATRVVSCNTTGLARAVTPLEEAYGVAPSTRRSSVAAATRPRRTGARLTTSFRTRSRSRHTTPLTCGLSCRIST